MSLLWYFLIEFMILGISYYGFLTYDRWSLRKIEEDFFVNREVKGYFLCTVPKPENSWDGYSRMYQVRFLKLFDFKIEAVGFIYENYRKLNGEFYYPEYVQSTTIKSDIFHRDCVDYFIMPFSNDKTFEFKLSELEESDYLNFIFQKDLRKCFETTYRMDSTGRIKETLMPKYEYWKLLHGIQKHFDKDLVVMDDYSFSLKEAGE